MNKPKKVKAPKYFLGEESFATWAQAIAHTKRILARGCRPLDKIETAFAKDLFSYHPNAAKKLQDGIASIKVGTPAFGTGPCFIFTDLKGIEQDISHKKCIPSTKADPTSALQQSEAQDRIKAYRNAISNDINCFWESRKQKQCKCCKSTLNIQVDHVNPLVGLINEFERLYKVVEYPKLKRVNHSLYAFQFDDEAYVQAWLSFHKKEARLQFLCSTCNAEKQAGGLKYQPVVAA